MYRAHQMRDRILTVVLAILSLAWVYPVVMILFNSLKKETAISTGTAFELPTGETFGGLANYADAIANLNTVMQMNEGYDDGQAMWLLARSYEASGDTQNAASWTERVQTEYPDIDTTADPQQDSGEEDTWDDEDGWYEEESWDEWE